MRLELGNIAPHSLVVDPDTGESTRKTYDHIAQTSTVIELPEYWRPETDPRSPSEWAVDQTYRSVVDPGGIWAAHSSESPTWVECADWPALEKALREWYGVGGKPKSWKYQEVSLTGEN